jgi:pilus assembly protein CpaC
METRPSAVVFSTIVLALAVAPAVARPQDGPQPHQQAAVRRDLTLVAGKGELLQFSREVQRVAVAEPKIADGIVVSPSEVMITAKGVGRTTVVIWETGAAPVRYEVTVAADTAPFDAVKKLLAALEGATIDCTGNEQTLVLTGKAVNGDQSKRAAAIASTHAKNVVNLIEVPAPADPRQILLQVRFASVDRVALSELGFNWFSRNSTTLGTLGTEQFQSPRFSQLQFQDQNFSNTTINFADLLNLFVFRPDLNIGATIRALQSRNLLQILAEPNLITLEGREASFLAGGEFPFPTLTSTSTGGAVSPVVTVQFKKFGVQLNFTPDITPRGAIHLKVKPEVSAIDFANAVTLQGFLIPAISTRYAETEVLLKDGESFAIAGLIDNRVVQTLSRVKGLGDVPIVGNLFRSRSTKKSTDELLVVVTPRFVRPLAAGEEVKLPDRPETWLPSVADEHKGAAAANGKKHRRGKKGKGAAADVPQQGKPEFVGPSGHQEPGK